MRRIVVNKIIKNYIAEVDYEEALEIMEAAHNRIKTIIDEKENAWEWMFNIMQLAADYKERLHLVAAPQEQYHCKCADYRRNYEN